MTRLAKHFSATYLTLWRSKLECFTKTHYSNIWGVMKEPTRMKPESCSTLPTKYWTWREKFVRLKHASLPRESFMRLLAGRQQKNILLKFGNFWVGQIFKLVESFFDAEATLRSFSGMALPARGVSKKMLQWLDWAGLPHMCIIFEFGKLENLTNMDLHSNLEMSEFVKFSSWSNPFSILKLCSDHFPVWLYQPEGFQ